MKSEIRYIRTRNSLIVAVQRDFFYVVCVTNNKNDIVENILNFLDYAYLAFLSKYGDAMVKQLRKNA